VVIEKRAGAAHAEDQKRPDLAVPRQLGETDIHDYPPALPAFAGPTAAGALGAGAPGVSNCARTLNLISSPVACAIGSACVLTISTDRLKNPDASRLATKSEMPVSVVHFPSITTSPPTCFSSVSQSIGGSARLI